MSLLLFLSACGGGGGGGGAVPVAATSTAVSYTGGALIGELVTYTVDTTKLTYSYTITASQYGLTGRTGSGTLTRNADGSYTPSGVINGKIAVLPSGLFLGAIRETVNGTPSTVYVFGASNLVTNFTDAAATYNYVERYCIAQVCTSAHGTFRVTSGGTWNSCSGGNLTTGCTGTAFSGTLNYLGNGLFQVLAGSTSIGTASAVKLNGKNSLVLDLNNSANGLGLLVGSEQETVTAAQTDGTWVAGSTTGLTAKFTVTGNAINYQTINDLPSVITNTVTINSPWAGMATSGTGGVGILAGTNVYVFKNANGYAEVGVKIQ